MGIEVQFVLGIDALLSLDMQSRRGRQVHYAHLHRKIAVYNVQTAAARDRQCPAGHALKVDLLRYFSEPTLYLYGPGQLDFSCRRQLEMRCRHLGLKRQTFVRNPGNTYH